MSRCLIIDGYNAISKIRKLEAKKDISLEASRMHFINILMNFTSQKRIFDKVFIVFDSKSKELGVRKESYGDIEVLFTMHDRDADSVIVDLLREAPPGDIISVASDDNFVRNHTRVYGQNVISISELENIIMLKKKAPGGKIKDKHLENNKIRDINEELKKHWRL